MPPDPEDTVFRRLVLDVESDSCEHCGATLHVCDHRFHRIHTLQGPRRVALSPGSRLRLPLPASLPNPQPRRRVVSHPALVDHRLGRLLLDAHMDMPAGSRFAHWMRRPI